MTHIMGDIGDKPRRVEVLPAKKPVPQPVKQPAPQPVKPPTPEKVPA